MLSAGGGNQENWIIDNEKTEKYMKWILTTVMMMAVTIGAKAQYVTYNHDSPKMNQITVGETGVGALKPELYYTLLHNKYKKTAAVKNKLAFRTTAGVASYQQVDEAEAIDSTDQPGQD